MKPGYQTTEFWLTIATNVATLLTTLAGTLPPEKTGLILVIANGLYALSRGWAKAS